jgi:hypothetical protein
VGSKGAFFSEEPQWLESLVQTDLKSTQAFHIPLDPDPDNPWPPRIREGSQATEAEGKRRLSLYHLCRRRGDGLDPLGGNGSQKLQGEVDAPRFYPTNAPNIPLEVFLDFSQGMPDLIGKFNGDEGADHATPHISRLAPGTEDAARAANQRLETAGAWFLLSLIRGLKLA